ncbi:Uncharacterised protein [marine metagenome]|jgi:hypothetical protein
MMLTQIAAGIFMSLIALAVFVLILKLIRDTLQTIKNQKKSKD